eukprot:scaffold1770_cov375-Prasinococcus_capsulatus_cf.AAC.20
MSAERSGARVDIWVMVLPTLLLATGVALVFVLRAVTILALRPADKRAQHLHDKLRRACVKGGEAKGRTLSTMIVLGSVKTHNGSVAPCPSALPEAELWWLG